MVVTHLPSRKNWIPQCSGIRCEAPPLRVSNASNSLGATAIASIRRMTSRRG